MDKNKYLKYKIKYNSLLKHMIGGDYNGVAKDDIVIYYDKRDPSKIDFGKIISFPKRKVTKQDNIKIINLNNRLLEYKFEFIYKFRSLISEFSETDVDIIRKSFITKMESVIIDKNNSDLIMKIVYPLLSHLE
jgi:capsule polysaccharide export protein KpsC/LpsZ